MDKKKGGITALKIVAAILVLIMGGSLILQSFISVGFLDLNTDGDSVDALSADFLQENIEYFTMTDYERLQLFLTASLTSSDTVEHHYAKAAIALADEDYNTALSEIQACIELTDTESSDYQELLIKEGCIMAMMAMYEEASHVFEQILEVDPDNTDILLLQAQIMVELGDAVGAVEALDTYLELTGPNVTYYAIMTQLCYEALEYEKSVAYGEAAIEMDASVAEDGEVLRYIGYSLLLGTGDYEGASVYFTQALELLPEDADLYNFRGLCYLALGYSEEAIQDFNQAIDLGLNGTSQYYNRGICYLNLGEIELSKADLEMAIEVGDDEELSAIAELIIEELDAYLESLE